MRAAMRWCATAAAMLAIVPATAPAQTEQVDPQAAREAEDAAAVTPEDSRAQDRAVPLAAGRGRDAQRIRSRNEAYNLNRAAEGRVGVRLGDDMSFPVATQP